MHLTVITPEHLVMAYDDVEHVLLPVENGELGVLPGHVAMVCTLQIGPMRVDLPEESVNLATSGGFVEVAGDRITVLAETAEKAEEIDVERAEEARDRARELLGRRTERTDHAAAEAALRRALNRLRVAGQD